MQAAPIPDNEEDRIRALREYDLLDTPAEEQFDAIAHIASFICETNISLISLIDETRQWFKAVKGLDPSIKETDRAISFCAHAILQQELFEVQDSLQDERFRDNPMVAEGPRIRFYAGVPLINAQGFALGTLCVIDQSPHRLSQEQKNALKSLARILIFAFEDRRAKHFSEHAGKILDHSRQPVFILDCPSKSFLYANEFVNQYLVQAKQPLQHLDVSATFPEVAECIRGFCNQDLNNHQEEYIERTYLCLPGSEPIPVGLHIMIAQRGNRRLVLLLGQDLSELSLIREQARKVQLEYRKLATVAQRTDNPVIITDHRHRTEWVNPSFERVMGFSLEEVQGRNPGHFLQGPETDPATVERMRQGLKQNRSIHEEILNYTKEGEPRWLEMEIQPIFDEEGQLSHFVSIQTDITAHKEQEVSLRLAKERAEAATRSKSEFLANISHELRTPLNGIVGIAELLAQPLPQSVQQDYLQTLNESAQSLLHIINDLLDLTKIESNMLQLELEPFDVRLLMQSVTHLFRPRAEAKGLEISCEITEGVPRQLRGDPLRLKQVIMNLLSNAVKFTNQGRIQLTASVIGKAPNDVHLRFKVRDTGVGIPEESLEHIFGAFSQVEGSSTRRFGGTGLGLTICRKLVRMMGGDIEATSRPGQGSCFSFDIHLEPLADHEIPTPPSVARQSSPSPVAAGKHALVVDDNEVNRKVVGAMLQHQGLKVSFACGGEEAIEVFRELSPDIVFTDIQMPGMDGFELTRRLREMEKPINRHVSIVALTAHTEERYAIRCMSSGMDGYLPKPITLKALGDMLETLFQKNL